MSEIDLSAGEVEDVEEARPPRLKGDLTHGPILGTLVAFSIPLLIGNMVQTLNGSINAVWIGRLLGESALAATTNANGVMFLLFAVTFGFAMAGTVRIGQHFGARNLDAARRSFGSGIGFSVAISAMMALLGWFFAPDLLRLLGTPAESFGLANIYLRVLFISIPFGTFNMVLSMGLRSAGDAKTPMLAMVVTLALDIVLNPLLIRGLGPVPPLGIAGSAIASFAAGLGGVVLQLIVLYRRDLPLRLRGPELGYLVPERKELAYTITKGLPMGAQMLLVSSAQMVMIGLVNRGGIDATASYGASMQLWNYLQMPAFAIASGVSAMVAQNIGAGQHARVGEVTKAGMISNLAMTGLLSALIVTFASPLLALFLGGSSPALPLGVHIQQVVTWSFIVMGVSMIVGGTMRAYGVVWWPLFLQFIAFYPVRLGFYFAAYPTLGSEALWWSFPVASLFSAVGTAVLYTRGSWRKKRTEAYQVG
jgi:putative MATE family efflux protein